MKKLKNMKKPSNEINIEQISNFIMQNMTRDLTKVLEVLNLEIVDLSDLIEKLTDEEKDKVIKTVINKQLEKLNAFVTFDKYRKVSNKLMK